MFWISCSSTCIVNGSPIFRTSNSRFAHASLKRRRNIWCTPLHQQRSRECGIYMLEFARSQTVLICLTRDSIVEHPLEVLEYAARHSHMELATEAARLSMGLGLPAVVQVLPAEVVMKWVRKVALKNHLRAHRIHRLCSTTNGTHRRDSYSLGSPTRSVCKRGMI